MARYREKKPKTPETQLQAVFVRRVKEEMGEMSVSQLARRTGAPPQTTLNDVLNAGAVPGLTVVAQIAFALGVHAWELMKERPTATVTKIPDFYKPMFSGHETVKKLKARRR